MKPPLTRTWHDRTGRRHVDDIAAPDFALIQRLFERAIQPRKGERAGDRTRPQ